MHCEDGLRLTWDLLAVLILALADLILSQSIYLNEDKNLQ